MYYTIFNRLWLLILIWFLFKLSFVSFIPYVFYLWIVTLSLSFYDNNSCFRSKNCLYCFLCNFTNLIDNGNYVCRSKYSLLILPRKFFNWDKNYQVPLYVNTAIQLFSHVFFRIRMDFLSLLWRIGPVYPSNVLNTLLVYILREQVFLGVN